MRWVALGRLCLNEKSKCEHCLSVESLSRMLIQLFIVFQQCKRALRIGLGKPGFSPVSDLGKNHENIKQQLRNQRRGGWFQVCTQKSKYSPEMTLRTSIVCEFLMQLITWRSDVLAIYIYRITITSTHPHRPRKGRRPGAAHVFWLRIPGHEAVVLGSNINSSNSLIVSCEFI